MLILSLICETEGCHSRIDGEEVMPHGNTVYHAEEIADGLLDEAMKTGWMRRRLAHYCPPCARVQAIIERESAEAKT